MNKSKKEPKKVPQVQFDSPEHLKKCVGNNYFNWWLDYTRGIERRKEPPFQRFMKKYPRFSARLIRKTTEAYKDRHSDVLLIDRLPWDDLYLSYKGLSKLVYEEDIKYPTKRNNYLLG